LFKPLCGCTVSRRGFLGGVAGLGASTLLPAQTSEPTVQGNKNRIDTHHHFFSPGLNAVMTEKKIIQPPMVNWSLQKTLDDMDAAGTATSILSATTPQVSFLDEELGKKMAR